MKNIILMIALTLTLATQTLAAGLFSGGQEIPTTLQTATFSLGTTGQAVAGVSGEKIKVYAIHLVIVGTPTINWQSNGTNIDNATPRTAGTFIDNVTPPAFLFTSATGTGLFLVTSGTGTVHGRVSYWTEKY